MTDDNAVSGGDVQERVRAYVRENFLYMRPDWKLGDDDPLLRTGVVDSIGVIELVEFVQGEFRIGVAEEEITEQNFGTLAAIARFVSSKIRARSTQAA
ncbi:MAG TPA: acyl carrier protein [Gemmatimonadales bacterium]|nr:acyl carrier protein [Gemmatimonadales bacterium]